MSLLYNKQYSLKSLVEVTDPEKGKELHKGKTEGLLLHFDSIFEHWKALAKVAKRSVIKLDPSNILQEHINTIQEELSEINSVYDAYRRIDSPAHDMHRKLDKVKSVTSIVLR